MATNHEPEDRGLANSAPQPASCGLLGSLIDSVPLAFVDVETTGLSPYHGDRVCEIAILRCEGDVVVDAMQQLIRPQRPMGSGALKVHGITDEMLRNAPLFGDVQSDVLDLLDGAVLVGHNAPFDISFVAAELDRLGAALPVDVALDTLRLARNHVTLRSYALHNVSRALDVEVSGRSHRAMVDVLLTRGVFLRLVDRLWRRGVRTVADYVDAQGGPLEGPSRGPQPSFANAPPEVQRALQQGLLLRLRYISEAGDRSERVVRPIAIVGDDRNAYLVAHCYLRDAKRTFRLDRVLDMELVSPSE